MTDLRTAVRISARKRLLAGALAAVLTLAMAACGGGGGSSGGGTHNLTVGVQTKVLQTYYPQLAEKLGYFKKEGLKVRVREREPRVRSLHGADGAVAG